MAYGQWKVDIETTIKEFGYHPNDLSYGSKKPVKCICEACGVITNKRFCESNRKHVCKSIINGENLCSVAFSYIEINCSFVRPNPASFKIIFTSLCPDNFKIIK